MGTRRPRSVAQGSEQGVDRRRLYLPEGRVRNDVRAMPADSGVHDRIRAAVLAVRHGLACTLTVLP